MDQRQRRIGMDSTNNPIDPEWKGFLMNAAMSIDNYIEEQKHKPAWISVKDRLPNEDEDVILCSRRSQKHVYVTYGHYHLFDDKPYFENDCGGIRNVTYWMPLPEPPEAKNV